MTDKKSELVFVSENIVPVNSANVLDLVRYLDDWMAESKDIQDKFKVTTTLGWLAGCAGFVMTNEVVE